MPGLDKCVSRVLSNVSQFVLSVDEEQRYEQQQQQRAGNARQFVHAAAGNGSMPGYVYKQGPQGLGYYEDVMKMSGDTSSCQPDPVLFAGNVSTVLVTQPSYLAADALTGSIHGCFHDILCLGPCTELHSCCCEVC